MFHVPFYKSAWPIIIAASMHQPVFLVGVKSSLTWSDCRLGGHFRSKGIMLCSSYTFSYINTTRKFYESFCKETDVICHMVP